MRRMVKTIKECMLREEHRQVGRNGGHGVLLFKHRQFVLRLNALGLMQNATIYAISTPVGLKI
jgi:hypothetical protein